MRVFSVFFLSLTIVSAFAQLSLRPINRLEARQDDPDTTEVPQDTKTYEAVLPVWDDFSNTGTPTPDAYKVWGNDTVGLWDPDLSEGAFVGRTLAINPPSLGAITFDGLDESGLFHAKANNETDVLTSLPIDLSAYGERDGLILSFFWQMGGNVEVPDAADSLVLEFLTINSIWTQVWPVNEMDQPRDSLSTVSFRQDSVVLGADYLHETFRFRFRAVGDQNGPYDAWHLDWIYLNANRQDDTFYYLDRGFTGEISSLLSPFQSVPTHQLFANSSSFQPTTELINLRVGAYNLDAILQPAEYRVIIDVGDNRLNATFGGINPLDPNPEAFINTNDRVIQLPITADLLQGLITEPGDSLTLSTHISFDGSDDDFLDGSFVDLRVNDQVSRDLLLHNYYAYDDGTAEYAAGTNASGNEIAVQFWVEERDTLTGIDINFPNIDSTGSAQITLKVYSSLERGPLRTQSDQVITNSSINAFTRYNFFNPVIVSDTFYIAFEQQVDRYVGIGFDRSNPEASKYIYQNINGNWERNERISGALMMRAVFDTTSLSVLSTEKPALTKAMVYPNPTKGTISIDGDYTRVEILSLSGRKLMVFNHQPVYDLSGLETGLYLINIYATSGVQSRKLIIE